MAGQASIPSIRLAGSAIYAGSTVKDPVALLPFDVAVMLTSVVVATGDVVTAKST